MAGSDSKPLFDAEAVATWLDLRPLPDAEPGEDGTLPTYGDRFRRNLRLRGLVALRHELGSAERLVVDALAMCAVAGEGDGRDPGEPPAGLRDDARSADPRVTAAVRGLVEELGSPGAAADTVLELAERLESDLVVDTTPRAVTELISALAGPVDALSCGPDLPVVINMCAGTGSCCSPSASEDAAERWRWSPTHCGARSSRTGSSPTAAPGWRSARTRPTWTPRPSGNDRDPVRTGGARGTSPPETSSSPTRRTPRGSGSSTSRGRSAGPLRPCAA
ncbi:hypothetical protein [Streptomyces somaliensis]|uniref:hypothetical protein n=1 Tax=Streptomyces somaliensis TaxID=78355 RepID=UPI0034E96254|nr:hypothetical protein [Streptomyces somaliensis]